MVNRCFHLIEKYCSFISTDKWVFFVIPRKCQVCFFSTKFPVALESPVLHKKLNLKGLLGKVWTLSLYKQLMKLKNFPCLPSNNRPLYSTFSVRKKIFKHYENRSKANNCLVQCQKLKNNTNSWHRFMKKTKKGF